MRFSNQIDIFVLVEDNRADDLSKGFKDLYGIDCKYSQHKLQYERIPLHALNSNGFVYMFEMFSFLHFKSVSNDLKFFLEHVQSALNIILLQTLTNIMQLCAEATSDWANAFEPWFKFPLLWYQFQIYRSFSNRLRYNKSCKLHDLRKATNLSIRLNTPMSTVYTCLAFCVIIETQSICYL